MKNLVSGKLNIVSKNNQMKTYTDFNFVHSNEDKLEELLKNEPNKLNLTLANNITELSVLNYLINGITQLDGTVKSGEKKVYIDYNSIPSVKLKKYQLGDKKIYLEVGEDYNKKTKTNVVRYIKAKYPHTLKVENNKIILEVNEIDNGNIKKISEIDITNDFPDIKISKIKGNTIYNGVKINNPLSVYFNSLFVQGTINDNIVKEKLVNKKNAYEFIEYKIENEGKEVKNVIKYNKEEIKNNPELKKEFLSKLGSFKNKYERILNNILNEKLKRKFELSQQQKANTTVQENINKKEKIKIPEVEIDYDNIPF